MTSLLSRFRPGFYIYLQLFFCLINNYFIKFSDFGVIDGDLVSGYAWDDTKGWYE
jgi:hypothetical protein